MHIPAMSDDLRMQRPRFNTGKTVHTMVSKKSAPLVTVAAGRATEKLRPKKRGGSQPKEPRAKPFERIFGHYTLEQVGPSCHSASPLASESNQAPPSA